MQSLQKLTSIKRVAINSYHLCNTSSIRHQSHQWYEIHSKGLEIEYWHFRARFI